VTAEIIRLWQNFIIMLLLLLLPLLPRQLLKIA
jgi:hypothetical protein